MAFKKKQDILAKFDTVTIKLASPQRVEEWSYGEVTKPETINYRTQRPEKSGLFDEKIFGPEKDFECYCGKYRGVRFRGIVCEKCGVELTRAIVRRERMGHIDLACPVSHIWFLRGIPSRIALILGLSAPDVEKVVYFAGYIVTRVVVEEKERLLKDLEAEYQRKMKLLEKKEDKDALKEKALEAKHEIEGVTLNCVLDEGTYHRFSLKYGGLFEAKIGAEALYNILSKVDLEDLKAALETRLEKAPATEREKIEKRLALVEQLMNSELRPEWMFMTRIPVVPPALRPMVALEGGRHASSDINDLYRRVINRNNRLKKLIAIHAPDVILRNEKRILQEAVDALIDNTIKRNGSSPAMGPAQRRPLKSLADYLKGKQGYFRQNLLGKRVDYSGRSVIVVGPDLELDQCGLPKHMALELFRPFIIAGLLKRELAFNIRGASRLIEDGIPEVWAILEEVISSRHVLLNRAPTLHRQSIQAFRPVLIEGDSIQVHPLVCSAFNADFDGDQMAVHVPLSEEAQAEARTIMSAKKNILKPGSGDVVTAPRQDIILGTYWMTKELEGGKGEGRYYESPNAAITAFDFGVIDMRAKIKVLPRADHTKYAPFNGQLFETTVGRLLFNSVLPDDFAYVNEVITNKRMKTLVDVLIDRYGLDGIPAILDKIKKFGFKYATYAGITWSLTDLAVPPEKDGMIEAARKQALEIQDNFENGLLSDTERRRLVINLWQKTKSDIEKIVPNGLDKNGSVYDMVTSGARGSVGQLTMMIGMKGLIQNPKGDIIEFPITSSYKEGLTPIEYFITTHGSRKGLADTALKTAQAGYLTRRLYNVAQDVIVVVDDCGTKDGIEVTKVNALGIEVSIAKNIKGRVLAENIEKNGAVLFKKGHLLTALEAQSVEAAGVDSVVVRSPMACKCKSGVCQLCYGHDVTTNEQVELGEAVGTVAAQSLGEPSTQLTMNTKHAGGAASAGGDITQGLPRVEEVFDRRTPKNPAVIAHVDGVVGDIITDAGVRTLHIIPDGTSVKRPKKDLEYVIPPHRTLIVKTGHAVVKGQFLSDGSADVEEYFKYAGVNKAREYIIAEILKIYDLQGIAVSRKHLEVIVKQMFSRRTIKNPGDTNFSAGQVVEEGLIIAQNEIAEAAGKEPAKSEQMVLGITDVALTRNSWLSATSFQNTTRKLTEAAVKGSYDRLTGLNENVIVGRMIPAGTGFVGSPKHAAIQKLQETMRHTEERKLAEQGLTAATE
ncbi:MAG: DNA-directed RNA polymerase subunit beta' [Minisyncoccia bacterium]